MNRDFHNYSNDNDIYHHITESYWTRSGYYAIMLVNVFCAQITSDKRGWTYEPIRRRTRTLILAARWQGDSRVEVFAQEFELETS